MAAKMCFTRQIIFLMSVLTTCHVVVDCSKLNVPRVLLPYNHESPINFTLKVFEGGCYKWSCSRKEVVLLEEVMTDGCANEAKVSAITHSASRQTAIILAQDSGSGGILRCDVLVDAIHRLEIITTTRELYVEEAPEEFEVRAYDDQGNEFTTLEGIEMTWELQTVTDREAVVSAQTVLRFMTFAESPYEMPPAIAPLESSGRQGYMVLIEGKQTGSARLSVRVTHPAYTNLPSAAVDLMVVANLLLEPADVYVLPNTLVKYTVFHLKQGIFNPVNIQGTQYYLQVAKSEVAYLNHDEISVTSVELGTTEVILRDKNVKSVELVKQPTALVHVVHPSYLTISILPHNNPALIRGDYYTFVVDVFDKENNKILLGDNIAIETVIPPEYFETEYLSSNGSYLYGVPIQTGRTKIQATLSSIQLEDRIFELNPPLQAAQDLEIFDPLMVVPPLTILPWDPITKPVYNVTLTAIGGSGPLLWSSSNSDIVGVSQLGICRTKNLGSVAVTAAMVKNLHNKHSAEIHIKEALGIKLLEGVVEAEIETPLPLHIAAYTERDGIQVPFTVCYKLPFKVEPADLIFTSLPDVKPPEVDESCAVAEVVGKTPGFSQVKVSYESTTELEASTLVAAFRPLHPTYPESGSTVLALGSSRVVVFEGGPLPWIAKPSSHIVKVDVDDTEKLQVTKLEGTEKQTDVHAVEVLCQDLGEFEVTLTVGNEPSGSLPNPRSVSASVKVICALPDAISLSAIIKKPAAAKSPCPGVAKIGVSVAHCNKPLNMEVIVTDSENRKFDNISSLALKWGLSNEALASIPSEPSSLTQVSSFHGFSTPMIIYQVLHPVGEVGELLVTVKIDGYVKGVSEIVQQHIPPSLKASLPLRLVQDAVLNPPSYVLFRHNSNLLTLKVEGGSGFFELQTPTNSIVKLAYLEKDRKVTVRPVSDGDVTVTLVDVCLEAEKPATSAIRVASIASLDLVVVDRVELGGYLEAEVVAKDEAGQLIPAHSLMNLTPHPQANIITAVYKKVNQRGNSVYEVYGRHVGDTTLRVSAGNGGLGESLIYSPAKPIQVFPPLTLQPRNITLIIGAVYQVGTKGGPYPDATVEFSMENETIATTSHTGVVTARSIGVTVLTGQAVSINKESGQAVVYSQDTVIVNVIPLSKIRIYAPLTHLETGTSMPLYAFGSEDSQNPLAYATAVPPLLFEWSLNNKQIASFVGIFKKNGIVETKENNGIVRLKAESPGHVTVTLKVKPSVPMTMPNFQIVDNLILIDKIEIRVFETLQLKYPAESYADILMSPGAEVKVKTNRDGNGQMSYAIEGCNNGDAATGVVSVGPDGVVKSGSTTGQATVLVTVEENFGVSQSLAVLVEVKKISYIQADVQPFMSVQAGDSISEVPVGSHLTLHLSYHDNRGRIFHATNARPKYRASRFDFVGVSHGSSNNTLAVEVRGSGQTVLHIWDANNELVSDYLRIHSGSSISPDKAVVPLGGHVCFSSKVLNLEGSRGSWSAQGEAATVDAVSGVAATHVVGRSLISYEVDAATTGTTEVIVVPISQISVGIPGQSLSNGEIGMTNFVPITLSGEGINEAETCTPFEPPVSVPPFTCILALFPPIPEVDIKDIFVAKAIYSPGKGYGCEVTALSGPLLSIAMSESAVILEAVVVGKGLQGEVRSGQSALSFNAAPVSEVSEVKISNVEPSVTVMLHGLPTVINSLEVPTTSGDGSLVELSLGSTDGNRRPLTISAKETTWISEIPTSPIVMSIASPLSRSSIQVNVLLEMFDGECAVPKSDLGIVSVILAVLTNPDRFVVSFLSVILTVVCLVIGYQALFGTNYRQTKQTEVFAGSPAPAPAMTPLSPGHPTPESSPEGHMRKHLNYSSSPQRFHLWSDSREPIYGGVNYRRGAYDGSPTYVASPK
ncbi:nuclear pore membrane glycoprotein 210-like [Macrobrachium nipponense]|uniref:nuclear pore membrane glycoprotein 210-like n=1 Tax=Macrobrachium nipponense TaxID=159736 RepID=UPI0030C8AFFD